MSETSKGFPIARLIRPDEFDTFASALSEMHENALVAWDRDGVPFADTNIVVCQGSANVLGYVYADGAVIYRLVLAPEDPLGVHWISFSVRNDREIAAENWAIANSRSTRMERDKA